MPISKKTVYLTADRSKVVDENSPDAAFLLARAGAVVSEADAKQYKLETDATPGPDAPAKAKAPEANKAKLPEANK